MPIFKRARWFEPFLKHCRYKFIEGGRWSGKTTHVAGRLVEIAWRTRVRVLCCREIERSMINSVYESVKKAVILSGLYPDFTFRRDGITCKKTGSEFIFAGLHSNPDKILSMEDVTFAWVEQAEKVSDESLKLLTPTIRGKCSEIWFTWNPRYPTDPIQLFFEKVKSESLSASITYRDNPFFSEEAEKERSLCERYLIDDYAHIWLGDYRERTGASVLLPYAKLKKAVGLYKKVAETLKHSDRTKMESQWAYGGLDVADGGPDTPALAIRQGCRILIARELNAKNGYEIASQALPELSMFPVARCYYDATGVGASIKSEFIRAQKSKTLSFFPEPFFFGGKVKGKDKIFTPGVSNGGFFARLNAQGYWNLRLRLERSCRLCEGDNISLDSCLCLPTNTSDKILQELSQIAYDRDLNDKIIIDKKNGCASPNVADAIMMSFARDIEKGIIDYV